MFSAAWALRHYSISGANQKKRGLCSAAVWRLAAAARTAFPSGPDLMHAQSINRPCQSRKSNSEVESSELLFLRLRLAGSMLPSGIGRMKFALPVPTCPLLREALHSPPPTATPAAEPSGGARLQRT